MQGLIIIFTIFSSSVGIPFARQAGELKIPAMQVGINVEAQKDGFWQATQGMGNYVFTTNTYARGVEYNELTKPFVDAYIKNSVRRPPTTQTLTPLSSTRLCRPLKKPELSTPTNWLPLWKTTTIWCPQRNCGLLQG